MRRIITLIMFCTLLVGCTNNKTEEIATKSTICQVEECCNPCVEIVSGFYEDYCMFHICEEDYCGFCKDENSDFCFIHKADQIILTDSQIKEVKTIVDDYIKQLLAKHPNILAVNLFSDTPKTDDYYIKYRCNVVREDSNTNLATIYVYISDNGTFKVSKLEYDE